MITTEEIENIGWICYHTDGNGVRHYHLGDNEDFLMLTYLESDYVKKTYPNKVNEITIFDNTKSKTVHRNVIFDMECLITLMNKFNIY